MHSIHTQNRHINLHALQEGLRDGVPIALGYLAVSFSLGIAAQAAGLTPFPMPLQVNTPASWLYPPALPSQNFCLLC